MSKDPKPIHPALLNSRAQMSLAVQKHWKASLNGRIVDNSEQ